MQDTVGHLSHACLTRYDGNLHVHLSERLLRLFALGDFYLQLGVDCHQLRRALGYTRLQFLGKMLR